MTSNMIKNFFKSAFLFFVVFLTVFICFQSMFFSTTVVEGTSMNPTLVNGDILLVNRLSAITGIKQGDIVVCDYPDKEQVDGNHCIKRVIGTEGDVVSVKDGKLYINGVDVTKKYYKDTVIEGTYPSTEVPKDCYFVMGDNVNVSYDSRSVGMIKASDIIGKTEIKFK